MADKSESRSRSAGSESGLVKGEGEVQAKFDEATEQGFFGRAADPIPNERYSLESGPDSPTVAEQRAAAAQAEAEQAGEEVSR